MLAVTTPRVTHNSPVLLLGMPVFFGFLLCFHLSVSLNKRPTKNQAEIYTWRLKNFPVSLVPWHSYVSQHAVLPSEWTALHTSCERSRIVTKTPPPTWSFLFLTRARRDCSSHSSALPLCTYFSLSKSRPFTQDSPHYNLKRSFLFHLLPSVHTDPTTTFYWTSCFPPLCTLSLHFLLSGIPLL